MHIFMAAAPDMQKALEKCLVLAQLDLETQKLTFGCSVKVTVKRDHIKYLTETLKKSKPKE